MDNRVIYIGSQEEGIKQEEILIYYLVIIMKADIRKSSPPGAEFDMTSLYHHSNF